MYFSVFSHNLTKVKWRTKKHAALSETKAKLYHCAFSSFSFTTLVFPVACNWPGFAERLCNKSGQGPKTAHTKVKTSHRQDRWKPIRVFQFCCNVISSHTIL